jgi:hypothetical protein
MQRYLHSRNSVPIRRDLLRLTDLPLCDRQPLACRRAREDCPRCRFTIAKVAESTFTALLNTGSSMRN